MIAYARFQVEGYVRSLRVVYPLVGLALLMALVLSSQPSKGDSTEAQFRTHILGSYGDAAVFMFFICAWATRGLLDTEPDTQRQLSFLAARRPLLTSLFAAYVFNVLLVVISLGPQLPVGLQHPPGAALPEMLVMHLLVAVPATALGALCSRAALPSPGTSLIVLLGAGALNLILGIGPLRVLTVPMIEWMRAANDSPAAFEHAFPALALRILAWSAVAGGLYAYLRRDH